MLRDAANGIREPAAMLLSLAIGHLWLTNARLPAAALAGVLLALRWELGLIALVILALGRVGWRPLAVGSMTAAVLMGPFLWASARDFDDPTHHSNYHARYYQNLEEAAREGIDPFSLPRYRGEAVTWSSFYLDFLGPRLTFERVARGFPVVVSGMAGGASTVPTMLMVRIGLVGILVGGIGAIFSPHRRLAVACVLLIAAGASGYAALYRLMEYRLVSFLVLPLAVLIGLGVQLIAEVLGSESRFDGDASTGR